jgi:integrase
VDLQDRVQKRTHVEAGKVTVNQFLDQWLAGKGKLRPTTRKSYGEHIRLYLKPTLGHLRLQDLTTPDIEHMYATIRHIGRRKAAANAGPELKAMLDARDRRNQPRPLSPATIRRVHTTLMSALNTAAKRRLIPFNPAVYVELEPEPRTRAAVWTEDRVAEWRATGRRPRVAVWTPTQTGAFLDHAADDRLYALHHLIAFRGLRRGEAVGLPWADVDLNHELLTVSQQTVQYGATIDTGMPKSESGARTIALDTQTVDVLRRHRAQQAKERLAYGQAWVDTGLVFTREDGSRLVPEHVSRHFEKLVRRAGLPPVRLHDLRHGAATLALASGANLKVVSEMLGHSSIGITANTYTSVLPELAREAAEAAVRLVPRASSRPRGPISAPSRPPEESEGSNGEDKTAGESGGRGIRTHGDIAATAVFKTAAIGH